jgi:STE24 endopeptidase
MRNLAERITRFKPLQTLIYWLEFLVVTTILGAPLAIYEGYFRERQYGLATQTFGPWMGEQFEMLLVNTVIGGIAAMVLFGVVRHVPRTWWIWGAVVSMCFLVFLVMIGPVLVFPIFNKFTVLDDHASQNQSSASRTRTASLQTKSMRWMLRAKPRE